MGIEKLNYFVKKKPRFSRVKNKKLAEVIEQYLGFTLVWSMDLTTLIGRAKDKEV